MQPDRQTDTHVYSPDTLTVALCTSAASGRAAVTSGEEYTQRLKNDHGVPNYSFDAHQPILIIFGRDVADRVFYQTVFPTSPD